MSKVGTRRRAVNVSISAELLQAARNSKINLSATLEVAIGRELRLIRMREWLEQNSGAIEAYNLEVEERGTFSDGLRTF